MSKVEKWVYFSCSVHNNNNNNRLYFMRVTRLVTANLPCQSLMDFEITLQKCLASCKNVLAPNSDLRLCGQGHT